MKTRNKVTLILVIAIFLLLMINLVIPAYLYRQSDKLGFILYNCELGIERYGILTLFTSNNGTHTIDEDSCTWIKNSNYKHANTEFQHINKMSCDKLIERHTSGEPYIDRQNKIFAKFKISNCNFKNDWSETQKKIDDWRLEN